MLVLIQALTVGNAQSSNREFNAINSSNPYGLTDLDSDIRPGLYAYCRWGVLQDATQNNDATLHFTRLTAGSNQLELESELFLSSAKDSLRLRQFSDMASRTWVASDGNLDGRLLIQQYASLTGTFPLYLMRKLHFTNSIFVLSESAQPVALNAENKKVVVLVHGRNPDGKAYGYDREFADLVSALYIQIRGTDWRIVLYRWEADANSVANLSPAIDGTESAEIGHQHGQHLGELLSRIVPGVEKIHFIAHSAGSWVARSATKYLIQNTRATVQVTLLDPFIPGAVSGISSSLTRLRMDEVVQFSGSGVVWQAENYYSDDGPAIAGTQETFAWGDRGLNRLVGRSTDVVIQLGGYGGHNGPISFFADIVLTTDGQPPLNPSKLNDLGDTTLLGWRRSIFQREPVFTSITPTSQIVKSVGEDVTLTAQAYTRAGDDTISYRWLKDGQPLSDQAGHVSGSMNSTSLLISNLGSSDAGEYKLRATTYGVLVSDSPASVLKISGSGGIPATHTLTISSLNPNTGVFVYVSPNSNENLADGTTVFSRNFDHNVTVTLVAPKTVGSNQFTEWQKDGTDAGNNTTVVVMMDADHEMKAVYGNAPATLPTVTVAASVASAAEQGNSQGQFNISRTGATAAPLTVRYSVGGTADNGVDFTALSGLVTLPSGSISADIGVVPIDDNAVESAETVILTLAADPAYSIGSPSSATVTIADNDSPTPPSVTTAAARATTSTAALAAAVNPNGSPTTTWFEWGTSSTLTSYDTTPAGQIGSGTAPLNLNADLANLTSGTVYYFRAVASSAAGIVRGTILTFTTTTVASSGSIRVSIVPQAATDAGAQWKLTSESAWRNSGAIVSGLALGTYSIEFKTISGWTTPVNKQVAISSGQPEIWINSDLYVLQPIEPLFNNFRGIAYGNNTFVVTGGGVVTTPDGISWTRPPLPPRLEEVAFVNNLFIATTAPSTGAIMTSPDGIAWTTTYADSSSTLGEITYGNGTFVLIRNYRNVMISRDGFSWTTHSFGIVDIYFRSVTYANGQFVAVGDNSWIATSPDGIAWTPRFQGSIGSSLYAVAEGNNRLVAVGYGDVVTSPDGVNWTRGTLPSAAFFSGLAFANNVFVAVGSEGTFVTSPDGLNWTARKAGTTEQLTTVAYGNSRFVAAGNSGALLPLGNSFPSLIVMQPQNYTGQIGENVTFAVGATGPGVLTYQWQKSGVELLNQNSAVLTLNNVGAADAAEYSVRVTSGDAIAISQPATLTVTPPSATRIISLSGDLAFGSVILGRSVQRTLTISNTGNATLTVSSISYPSGFSGDWSGAIAAGASQTVMVTFSPSAETGYGGNLAVNSDKTDGIETTAISGTGIPVTYTVTPVPTANGTINPSTPQTVHSGGTIPFSAVPAVGYVVDQWLVNGISEQTGGNAYTLSNVTADKTVQVTFKVAPTLASGPSVIGTPLFGSSVSPAATVTIRYTQSSNGGNRALFVIPAVNCCNVRPTSVTYQGLPLTEVSYMSGRERSNGSLWALVNPPTGANDLIITYASPQYIDYAVFSLQDVDGTTVADASGLAGTHQTSSISTEITPQQNNSFVVAWLVWAATTHPVPDDGQTSIGEQSSGDLGLSISYRSQQPAAPTKLGYNWSNGNGNADLYVAAIRYQQAAITKNRVSGKVRYYSGSRAVPGVAINPGATGVAQVSTASDGSFEFNLDTGTDYTLTPAKDADASAADGLSTFDISLVRRHILRKGDLTSAYAVLAADVDGDGSVSTFDISLIRRVVLRKATTFPGPIWKFVRSDQSFADLRQPWNYDKTRRIAGLSTEMLDLDFFAIKAGDVDGNWSPSVGPQGGGRIGRHSGDISLLSENGEPTVRLRVEMPVSLPGGLLSVPLSGVGFGRVTSLQFTLEWDPQVLEFIRVRTMGLPGLDTENVNLDRVSGGKLMLSWDDPNIEGVSLPDQSTLFALEFRALAGGGESPVGFVEGPVGHEVSVDGMLAALRTENAFIRVDPSVSGPRICSVTINPEGTIAIFIPTVDGQTYVLESTERLESAVWQNVMETSGDGTTKALSDNPTTSKQRFYRVRVQPE